MPRDGSSGAYNLPEAAFVYDTVISETAVNSNFSDIATALSASIAKDGQTNPTANLPMATYRHTGVGNASARTDYAAAGQVQDGSLIWCGTAGGTKNALTLTPTPAITAYATGSFFFFISGATQSDDAVTIAISGLTTKAGQINGSALSATVYIEASKPYMAFYDGTALQLTKLSPAVFSYLTDPMTTRGDIMYRNSSNVTDRLAVGAAGTAIMSDGTDPSWTGVRKQGLETIWCPATAMKPTVSNGCATLTSVETTAGRPDMNVLDFDASADEHAQFDFCLPKSWNEGTVTFRVHHTTTATDTDGVAWGLQGVAVSDGDTIDVAYGTAVVVTDAYQSTAEDEYVTAVSSAITIAGTPAAGDRCIFRIFRDVSDAADTAAEDARLLGVEFFFTTNAADDT